MTVPIASSWASNRPLATELIEKQIRKTPWDTSQPRLAYIHGELIVVKDRTGTAKDGEKRKREMPKEVCFLYLVCFEYSA
jgi:hypothetical protein